MAASATPAEHPDPLAGNLDGTLLVFVVYQCWAALYYLWVCFRGSGFVPSAFERSGYASGYFSFELIQSAVFFVVTVIGLFLIFVRDPRTRGWWMTFGRVSVLLGLVHIWLVRALPHEHLRPIATILHQHGFITATVWLTYWAMSARVKIAFGPHYAQPEVSNSGLCAVATVAMVIALLARGAGSLI
jgi:hypothetical protein